MSKTKAKLLCIYANKQESMRAIIPIFLLLIVLLTSFKHAAIFVSFKLNQEYIAQNLCVERELEDSDCAGCCQLKKKQAEQSEDASNTQRKLKVNIEWLNSSTDLDTLSPKYWLTKTHVSWNNLYQFMKGSDCFHPPQVL